MTHREVTIDDFIMPEFRGKDPKDYEFRDDGKIVRKDRWENGVHSIVYYLDFAGLVDKKRGWEIHEIVAITAKAIKSSFWRKVSDELPPESGEYVVNCLDNDNDEIIIKESFFDSEKETWSLEYTGRLKILHWTYKPIMSKEQS